jgi:protein FAM32A
VLEWKYEKMTAVFSVPVPPSVVTVSSKLLADFCKTTMEKNDFKTAVKSSLKLKGGNSKSNTGIKPKKRKTPSAVTPVEAEPTSQPQKQKIQQVEKTEAEKAFEEAQHKKKVKRIQENLSKSHKQRVEEFNQKLSKLSDHYDIPKVLLLLDYDLRLNRLGPVKSRKPCNFTATNELTKNSCVVSRRNDCIIDLCFDTSAPCHCAL